MKQKIPTKKTASKPEPRARSAAVKPDAARLDVDGMPWDPTDAPDAADWARDAVAVDAEHELLEDLGEFCTLPLPGDAPDSVRFRRISAAIETLNTFSPARASRRSGRELAPEERATFARRAAKRLEPSLRVLTVKAWLAAFETWPGLLPHDPSKRRPITDFETLYALLTSPSPALTDASSARALRQTFECGRKRSAK